MARWYRNLARGSRSTGDNYLRHLGRVLASQGLTPGDVLRLGDREREDLVADCVDAELARGVAGTSVLNFKKAVRSFLEWHGVPLKRKIRIPHAYDAPNVRKARLPTQDDLRTVLNVADARARSAASLIAFAGLRPQVMGTEDGKDGLCLRDLTELDLETASFTAVPTRIDVPARLSKNNRAYFTFLGPEGCTYLEAYFRQRIEAGERLEPASPVIAPKQGSSPFLLRTNLSTAIRIPMRRAGLQEPPYILRSYFSSRSMLAESDGLLRDYRVFFMGHSGDIEARYALHKGLPDDTIEQMRAAYQTALRYLETQVQAPREDPALRMMGVILKAAGVPEDELADMDLAEKDEDEVVELLRDRLAPEQAEAPSVAMATPRQRIVGMSELDACLQEGWLFRSTLPDGRAVVEHV